MRALHTLVLQGKVLYLVSDKFSLQKNAFVDRLTETTREFPTHQHGLFLKQISMQKITV